MDIRTYDALEDRGREAVASWQMIRVFAPVAFERTLFPTRVRTLFDLKPLLDSFQADRFDDFAKELGGLSVADVEMLAGALADFVDFHRRTFCDAEIDLPVSTMISQYAIYTKLAGIPNRRRVLELGSGCGYLSFFLAADPVVERYDQVEITQCLYILQALVDSHCYGSGFRNAAFPPSHRSPVGLIPMPGSRGTLFPSRTSINVDREPRCVLHPWWRVDEALSRQYDVVTSNANFAEMSPGALRYYLSSIRHCLADDGVLLIQCLGSQLGGAAGQDVLKVLKALGFRPLAAVSGPHAGKQFALDNYLLIGARHPDYHAAAPDFSAPVFQDQHPLVRAVYGLDREDGPQRSRGEVVEAALTKIQQSYPMARK